MTADQLLKKQLKAEHKHSQKPQKMVVTPKSNEISVIRDGIMSNEDILPDEYPIFYDYCYVVEFEDGTAKVVVSNHQCKCDRFKVIHHAKHIRKCNLKARNIL
jgi:hypothetical protein